MFRTGRQASGSIEAGFGDALHQKVFCVCEVVGAFEGDRFAGTQRDHRACGEVREQSVGLQIGALQRDPGTTGVCRSPLQGLLRGWRVYPRLCELFRRENERYNSDISISRRRRAGKIRIRSACGSISMTSLLKKKLERLTPTHQKLIGIVPQGE